MNDQAATGDAVETYDLVIVGSGGGSMCAALAAQALGKSSIILEKNARIGGSTGYSGGVLWIPNNPLMKREGVPDSDQKGRLYFDSVVTYHGPSTAPAKRTAYLRTGPRMVEFLESKGMTFRRPKVWPDYYDDRPGGEPTSRSLMAPTFNKNMLGAYAPKLSVYPPFDAVPLGADDAPTLFMMKRTRAGKLMAARLGLRMLRGKLLKRHYSVNGGALQGRMLKTSLDAGLVFRAETPAHDLIVEDGVVRGVTVTSGGRTIRVMARDGVLVNTGGFSRNLKLRGKHSPHPWDNEHTSANPGDTGEILEEMVGLGAATDCLDEAWWVATSRNTDGTWPEGALGKKGEVYPFMHHLDLSLPNLIMVDQTGARFVNESGSYMEIGQAMFRRQKETGSKVPAWTIMDSVNRKYYPWGNSPPGKTPKSWIDSGYMKKADTLEELARLCNIDPAGLVKSVARFNGFCETGVDTDFNRGGRAFDRSHGDPTLKPNPNLGPITQGPFYAVAMYPGDVGTAGGVVTDEYARVMRWDGTPIPGLYATGNCTASVMGRTYPGAGASIGASFVFGYIAAHHAAGATGRLPFKIDGSEETVESVLRRWPHQDEPAEVQTAEGGIDMTAPATA